MNDPNELVERNRAQVNSEHDDHTTERYRQFLRHFPARRRTVLDVGCNTGRGGAILKAALPEVHLIGLDCVPERVAALSPEIYHEKICAFTDAINRADRSIDAIVAGEFLEHLPPDGVSKTLCEFFRILRLRGRLLLTTPNPHYLKNKFRGLSVLTEPSHLTQHEPHLLQKRLREIGFSRVRCLGSGRVSSKLGERFPLSFYGSYLMTADKW